MTPAAQPRLAVVFLMILTLGVSLGLPAQDVLDTVYDESEALPLEVIPPFSIVLRAPPSRTTQPTLIFFHPKLRAPCPFAPAHVRNTEVHRSTDVRALSSQLCILLC